MYGEVYVPYTPIGGSNMSRMANDVDINGTGTDYDGGATPWVRVYWQLPGGILGKNSWGKIFNAHGVQDYSDQDIYDRLKEDNIIDESSQVEYINQLVYDYVHILVTDPGVSWDDFKEQFPGCYS